jgi:hypothetical protein
MGQAAVDLPDPLNPAPLDNVPSADDLLAQMAGDEIDRLLAEAELETQPPSTPQPQAEAPPPAPLDTPPPPAAPPQATAPPDEADLDVARQMDALFEELQAAPPPPAEIYRPPAAPPTPQAKIDEADPNISQQLDDLFQQLSAELTPPPDASTPAPAARQPKPSTATTPAPLDPAEQLGPQERQTLTATIPDGAAAQTPAEITVLQTPSPDLDDAVPLHLRPLVWINTPIASFGDGPRRFIGNVAIMTLVNALLLLVYVFLFRR